MVWPILISVAVTPRISADIAASESIRQATALSAPTLVTKRIGIPRLLSSAALKSARSDRYWLRRAGTCHDAALDANPYSRQAGRKWPVTSFHVFGGVEIPSGVHLPSADR